MDLLAARQMGVVAAAVPAPAPPLPTATLVRPAGRFIAGLSMKTGAGAGGQSVLSGWLVGGLHLAAGDERVQVERPQPRSGEDDDLDARGTGGTMRTPGNQEGVR